jgi:hypothetical protein
VAWEQAQQATRADMFEHTGLEGEFPLNRLRFMKAKVFIEATRLGVPLDPASVNQIADDESAIAPTYGRHEWDAVAQSSYVQTIELLLLAGEFQRAQAMVDDARGMRGLHVKELFDNAKLLLKHPDAGHDSPEARLGYRSAFDLLRNPYYADHRKGHPAYTNQVLTMALMWQKFYEPGDGHYGLDRAIDLYWA